MDHLTLLGPLNLPDALALGLTILAWLLIGRLIERPPANRPSVSLLMQEYRHEWMRQFLTRQPRIFDASMIAIGGGVALMGNSALLVGIAGDLPIPADATAFRVHALLVIAFLANALLKFIWSHRLFGYCAILMAAVPNDHTDPQAALRAEQAGDLNITAAKSFNRGLRSIYFALGSLAWLLGPYALMIATLFTSAVLIRREFASTSREIMLRGA